KSGWLESVVIRHERPPSCERRGRPRRFDKRGGRIRLGSDRIRFGPLFGLAGREELRRFLQPFAHRVGVESDTRSLEIFDNLRKLIAAPLGGIVPIPFDGHPDDEAEQAFAFPCPKSLGSKFRGFQLRLKPRKSFLGCPSLSDDL